jgi:hypothetical protein
MNELSDLYNRIGQIDQKLIGKWQREVNKRIRRFVRNISSVSPFIDKPAKRMFGVRNSKDGQSLTIYGTAPNAGRMKAFNAPTNEWQSVRRYFHIYGRNGWRTIHKTQMVRTTAGTDIADVPYFGTSEPPEQYFGIRKGRVTLAYGKTDSGIALPVYAENSYPDWIMQNHRDDIDNIILEAGRYILSACLFNGGAK